MNKNRLKIEYLPIEKLMPYANNAKLHDDENVELIAESIKAYGFNDPVGIDERDEIIEGHGRTLAVNLLITNKIKGFKPGHKVPCIRLIGLSDAEKRAYRIAHNRITERGKYDVETLADEISALSEAGFNLELTGLSDKEIDALLTNDPSASDFLEPDSVVRTHTRSGKGKKDKQAPSVYEIVVELSTKAEQDEAYKNLKGLGYSCKMIRG